MSQIAVAKPECTPCSIGRRTPWPRSGAPLVGYYDQCLAVRSFLVGILTPMLPRSRGPRNGCERRNSLTFKQTDAPYLCSDRAATSIVRCNRALVTKTLWRALHESFYPEHERRS
jgi:hypothetical protein